MRQRGSITIATITKTAIVILFGFCVFVLRGYVEKIEKVDRIEWMVQVLYKKVMGEEAPR